MFNVFELTGLQGELLNFGKILIIICLSIGVLFLRWTLNQFVSIKKANPLVGLIFVVLLAVGVVKLHLSLFINPYQIIGAVLAGFYLGILIIYGLGEDNYPPPHDVKEKVLQFHQRVLPGIKRESMFQWFFNRSLALLGLFVTLPLWVAISVLIWMEDPGPIFFVKNSVGRGGINIKQLKFRTMKKDAEGETGPVLAQVDDKRILGIGRLLRKSALDELPQLINILFGQMAMVGPRPQRTVLVAEYLDIIPDYALRHQVMPGLAGLAQVAGGYYLPPRQKLRYDLLYIRNMSLGLDLKLILIAFAVVFWLRWKNNWDGKVPRQWYYWMC